MQHLNILLIGGIKTLFLECNEVCGLALYQIVLVSTRLSMHRFSVLSSIHFFIYMDIILNKDKLNLRFVIVIAHGVLGFITVFDFMI